VLLGSVALLSLPLFQQLPFVAYYLFQLTPLMVLHSSSV